MPATPIDVDFDLHGSVRIRLRDALERDVDSVARQLGSRPSPPEADADIVIRFADALDDKNLNLLGLNSAAYKGDDFYLLDARSGRAQAQIPLDRIGRRCDIVCRRKLSSIPLLADLVNLTFLSKGFVALHGSAFCLDDQGILIVGWEKGGKTEALLAFASRGAQFIGDEMIVVSRDGRRMHGVPLRIAVWDWQREYVRDLLPRRPLGQRTVSAVIGLLDRATQRFASGRLREYFPLSVLHKALPTLRRQRRSWYWPSELFGTRSSDAVVGIDKIFLVSSHEQAHVAVTPCDPLLVAERMRSSNEFERTHFYQYYRAFKFAFPQRRSAFLEGLDEAQAAALREAFTGKPAFTVAHPYPVPLDELRNAMLPSASRQT